MIDKNPNDVIALICDINKVFNIKIHNISYYNLNNEISVKTKHKYSFRKFLIKCREEEAIKELNNAKDTE